MLWTSTQKPNRRDLIRSVGASAGAAAIAGTVKAASKNTDPTFTHGIASGDPLQNRIILWTRVLIPSDPSKTIKGTWQVSADATFATIANSGRFTATTKQDHTVKIDAGNLKPGATYYYRFITGDIISPSGQTKTLPEKTDTIDLAVVSCANYSHGHFNVYKELSSKPFQAVLHLGDYIYEYAAGKYENATAVKQGRTVKPKTEVVSLEEYRTRYAQYRSDPDLQAAHAVHPFICVWDDHEVANDSWKHGAENHSDAQGNYSTRQKAAMQAYREWLPIRETNDVVAGKIYRSFELAQLGTLIMMDTRHIGRDRVLDYTKDLPYRTIPFNMTNPDNPLAMLDKAAFESVASENIKYVTVPFKLGDDTATPMTDWQNIKALDPKNLPSGYTFLPDTDKFKTDILGDKTRSILGAEQENWLTGELQKSSDAGKPWQILGQQLLSGKVGIPQLSEDEMDYTKSKFVTPEAMAFFRMLGQMGLPLNLDAWDGYPACRERIFKSVTDHANNVVFLAGDTHNGWAFNLKDDDGKAVAVELATPSVSSPGLEAYIPAEPVRVAEELLKASPELHYVNNENRGWLELSITSDEIKAQWQFVSTVLDKSYTVNEGPFLSTKAGAKTLS